MKPNSFMKMMKNYSAFLCYLFLTFHFFLAFLLPSHRLFLLFSFTWSFSFFLLLSHLLVFAFLFFFQFNLYLCNFYLVYFSVSLIFFFLIVFLPSVLHFPSIIFTYSFLSIFPFPLSIFFLSFRCTSSFSFSFFNFFLQLSSLSLSHLMPHTILFWFLRQRLKQDTFNFLSLALEICNYLLFDHQCLYRFFSFILQPQFIFCQ